MRSWLRSAGPNAERSAARRWRWRTPSSSRRRRWWRSSPATTAGSWERSRRCSSSSSSSGRRCGGSAFPRRTPRRAEPRVEVLLSAPPELGGRLRLGLLALADVAVRDGDPALTAEVDRLCASLRERYGGGRSAEGPGAADARSLYKAF